MYPNSLCVMHLSQNIDITYLEARFMHILLLRSTDKRVLILFIKKLIMGIIQENKLITLENSWTRKT